VKIIIDDEEPATARAETPKTNAEMIRTCSRDRPSVDAKNPIGLPMVVFAAFRLLASSDHGQPYINVAPVPSHQPSKPRCDAGRDHRAPSSTDRAARTQKTKRLILSPADRCLWVWLSRLWSRWRSALIIVKPETVIGWHRQGFQWYWTWKIRHGRSGRPCGWRILN
jgi:hypothetical protein